MGLRYTSHFHSFRQFASSSTKRKNAFRDFYISIPLPFDTNCFYKSRIGLTINELHKIWKTVFQNILHNNESKMEREWVKLIIHFDVFHNILHTMFSTEEELLT